jgi:type IV pilus assembly protein PilB
MASRTSCRNSRRSDVEVPTLGALDDDAAAVDADAPLIRLVNQIIVDAFKLRASDIHLEPLSKKFPIALPH